MWIIILIVVYDVNIYTNCIDKHQDGFDKVELYWHIFEKYTLNFMRIHPMGAGLIRGDGQTDTQKWRTNIRNFSNAPKGGCYVKFYSHQLMHFFIQLCISLLSYIKNHLKHFKKHSNMFRSSMRSSSGSSLFISLSKLLILKTIKIFKKYYQSIVVAMVFSFIVSVFICG